MANVYAFDIDDTMESGGQKRLPPTNGPVKWRSLRQLARDGHVVGICGNWENVPQVVPDWREFLSFLEPRPHPGYAGKHRALMQIREQWPGYDHYVMVGNDPWPHSARPAYWDRLYPGTLPVQHVPGQALLSNDIGAAAKAGWEFVKEDWFAAGQRTGKVPPDPPYPGAYPGPLPGGKSERPEMIYKHVDAEVLKYDDEQGIVEAIVSVTGNMDRQKDVIEPGAWQKAIETGRLPRVTIDHQWGARTMLGKTIQAEELMPGDPRLPALFQQNGWGGLRVVSRFNLDKQIAREAYSDLKGGFVNEFSVGFDVAKDEKGERQEAIKDGVRTIKSVGNWYEWSPVFMGANPETSILQVKGLPQLETTDGSPDWVYIQRLFDELKDAFSFLDQYGWVLGHGLGLKSDLSTQAKRQAAKYKLRVNGQVKYPINDCSDVRDAWALRGRSSIPKARVAAYVQRVAGKLGCKGPWNSGGKSVEPEDEATPPLPDPEQLKQLLEALDDVSQGVHALKEMTADHEEHEELAEARVTEETLLTLGSAVGASVAAALKARGKHSTP